MTTISLAHLIKLRDALIVAKPYLDKHGTADDYVQVLYARNLASAILDHVSESLPPMEVTP